MARLAAARLRNEGIDPSPLLEEAGLAPGQDSDVGAWIDAGQQVRFLNLAADALPDTMLGFHLAWDFDIRQAEMLLLRARLVAHARGGIRQGFAVQRRGQRKHHAVDLSREWDRAPFRKFPGVPRYADRHQMEFWMTALVRICRHLSETDLRPVRVSVTHPRFHGSEAFEDFLRCKVSFQAEPSGVDEIVRRAAQDALPSAKADPYLSRVMLSQCEQATASHVKMNGSLRGRVENEIAQALPHGRALMEDIARTLGMSKRTLARHLSEENASYLEILEGVRLDMAQHYLRDSDLPISEIAWLLGYAETSAFTNSFKRWTGSTPRQVRNAH